MAHHPHGGGWWGGGKPPPEPHLLDVLTRRTEGRRIWLTFGSLLAPFGSLLDNFWLTFGALWLTFGALGSLLAILALDFLAFGAP